MRPGKKGLSFAHVMMTVTLVAAVVAAGLILAGGRFGVTMSDISWGFGIGR